MAYLSSPFKWAGSKAKVLHHLLPVLHEHRQDGFCEPFVGACNVSLNFDAGYYIWNDLNKDLIRTYELLVRSPKLYKEVCEYFFQKGFDEYYELRDLFNELSLEGNTSDMTRVALFQYLNKHGFNGLCRYNKSGKFNVPVGTSTKPKQVPIEQIDLFFNRFANAIISTSSFGFEEVFERTSKCDSLLIYSDPPYVPLTSDFNYTGDGFDWEQQVLLKQLSKDSKHTCIISNHWTPLTEELYSDANEIHVFDVQRTISCKGSDRKKVQECIVVYNKTF